MRTGLFLSRDDGTISETVDVDALAETYSFLAAAKVYDSFFRYADQQDLLNTVNEGKLDAVVLAGNSPRYFEQVLGGHLVLDALKSQGVNVNKLAFANIKEQVALPHKGDKQKATSKARALIDVALAKVEASPAVSSTLLTPRRSVLVIGTTAAGLIAARELLAKGYRVYIMESGPSLRLEASLKDQLLPILTSLESNERAEFFFDAAIKDVSGHCGQYSVRLASAGGERTFAAGGIILSAGDDRALVKTLRTTLRVSVNRDGLPEQDGTRTGQTMDPGIWFIPFTENGGGLDAEVRGAATAVLPLTTLLDAGELAYPLFITSIDETLCGGCGTCVKTCAFAASHIDLARKRSVVDPDRCKGCGNCVTACPTNARDLLSLPREYVIRAIQLLSRATAANGDPRILAMVCKNCGHVALDAAGVAATETPGAAYSPGVMPLLMECGGSVDTQYVLEAFREGFDGVALLMCRDGRCRNVVGNTDMERRLGLFRTVLRSRNIDSERLRVVPVCAGDGQVVSEELKAFSHDLTAMGGVGIKEGISNE
jgi:heterodisulfide reductase subunit A-like polyferredoxin/coenzyme F420-reducing hydrogenase delta subunit